MGQYDFILDGITWSFSSVNCYNNCPKCFYLSYIDKESKTNNAFAEYGSFCHGLLEDFFKGKNEFFELASRYRNEYDDNVKLDFPPNKYTNLRDSYFKAGEEYFDNFTNPFEGYEVLGVEQKIQIEVSGYPFVGYIDLLVRDKDGNIIICDHKSKAKFTSKKEKRDYLHQLYLYSIFVKETYGTYPTKLVFNMFRTGNFEWAEFEKEELEKTKTWFVDNIQRIYADEKFLDKIELSYKEKGKKLSSFKKDDFFCNNLCSVKQHCNRSLHYIKG